MRYLHNLKNEDLFSFDGKHCGYCSKELVGRQSKWCSKNCSLKAFDDLMFAKGSSKHLRKKLFERDQGICNKCGVDCKKLNRISNHAFSSLHTDIKSEIPAEDYVYEFDGKKFISKGAEKEKKFFKWVRKIWKDTPLAFSDTKNAWEADHIHEVINGGQHTLENLQTLCLVCHKKKTKKLVKQLS